MRSLVFILAIGLAIYACKNDGTSNQSNNSDTPVKADSVASVSTMPIDSGYLLLDGNGFDQAMINSRNMAIFDLRPASAYKVSHIYKAISKPYENTPAFEAYFDTLDPRAPLAFYCDNGDNSAKAGMMLRSKGFQKIRVLKNGLIDWYMAEKVLVTF